MSKLDVKGAEMSGVGFSGPCCLFDFKNKKFNGITKYKQHQTADPSDFGGISNE